MSRSTRQQTLRMPLPKKKTKAELIQSLGRIIKRQLIAAGEIPHPDSRPPRYIFRWWTASRPETVGEVQADDRSTARGLIKKVLGLRKKDRLPSVIEIERVDNVASSFSQPPAGGTNAA